jgi:hypothetical protein
MCLFISQIGDMGSESKIIQQDLFANYFEYHFEGRKVIIDSVFDEPLMSEHTLSDNTMLGLVQKLILNILADEYVNKGNRRLIITYREIITRLQIVNSNYEYIDKDKQNSLAKSLNVSLLDVAEFYQITQSKLMRMVDRAFASMYSRATAEALKIKRIKLVSGEHRTATESERQKLLNIEESVLEEMKLDNKGIVFALDKWDEFYQKVVSVAKRELNVTDYYNAYSIVFTDRVFKDITKVEKFLSENYGELSDLLNFKIIDSHKKAYDDRFKKAEIYLSELYSMGKKKDGFKSDKYTINRNNFRGTDKYKENGKLLIDKTMKKSAKGGCDV